MKPFTPHSLITGNLQPTNLQCTVSDSNLILSPDIENRIDELWEIKAAEAKAKDLIFFNGQSYRINNWEYKDEILSLDLALFDFKHRSGLITMSRNGELDPTKIIQGGCFVGATVKTTDQQYVMVKLSGKSSLNNNVYDFLGGMAETDVDFDEQSYLFDVLHNEMEEEGSIGRTDVENCSLQMMYAGMHGHYGFYFAVALKLSATELKEKFIQNTDPEIDSLHFYSEEEYLETLKNHNPNKQLIADFMTGN